MKFNIFISIKINTHISYYLLIICKNNYLEQAQSDFYSSSDHL